MVIIMALILGQTPNVSFDLTAVLLAVLASGALTAFVSWILHRRKTDAETEGIVADTYSQVLADMRLELERYRKRLAWSDQRISHLEHVEARSTKRLRQLETALHQANIPIPREEIDPLDYTEDP
jgi:hypothetical protein